MVYNLFHGRHLNEGSTIKEEGRAHPNGVFKEGWGRAAFCEGFGTREAQHADGQG
jgi:hypothetical protein